MLKCHQLKFPSFRLFFFSVRLIWKMLRRDEGVGCNGAPLRFESSKRRNLVKLTSPRHQLSVNTVGKLPAMELPQLPLQTAPAPPFQYVAKFGIPSPPPVQNYLMNFLSLSKFPVEMLYQISPRFRPPFWLIILRRSIFIFWRQWRKHGNTKIKILKLRKRGKK